jgi:hypothetical protein
MSGWECNCVCGGGILATDNLILALHAWPTVRTRKYKIMIGPLTSNTL